MANAQIILDEAIDDAFWIHEKLVLLNEEELTDENIIKLRQILQKASDDFISHYFNLL